MPKKPEFKMPTAWSYSRLAEYRKCPRKFRYAVVEKLPQPKAPAMERGTRVHEALQAYVEGRARALPKLPQADGSAPRALSAEIAALLRRLRDSKAQCELEYAVDRSWKPASWFDGAAWMRAKLDVRLWVPRDKATEVFDHKTGRERAEEHAEQMEIYALAEWAHQPECQEVRASMVYADGGTVTTAVFADRKKTERRLRAKWEKLSRPMLADRTFRAAPSRECGWCPFSGRRGGPCDKG